MCLLSSRVAGASVAASTTLTNDLELCSVLFLFVASLPDRAIIHYLFHFIIMSDFVDLPQGRLYLPLSNPESENNCVCQRAFEKAPLAAVGGESERAYTRHSIQEGLPTLPFYK